MPLTTKYQDFINQSLKEYNFQRVLGMKGRCHDALIGEFANWWLSQDIDGMICNPARGSRAGSRRYFADLLFLERFRGFQYHEVKGVAEIENNENKVIDKIESLESYENYVRRGARAYPSLEFAILCYTLNLPNNELAEEIHHKIIEVSEDSRLLWICCEIGNSLRSEGEEADYSIYMPNYVKGYDYFYYFRNFSSVVLYAVKSAKQVGDITVPGE